jgi:hypothetical protein
MLARWLASPFAAAARLLSSAAPAASSGGGGGGRGVERGDTLGKRLLQLIYPKRSAVVVLRRWAEEGRTVQKYQLNRVVRELRKYGRYKHALEVRRARPPSLPPSITPSLSGAARRGGSQGPARRLLDVLPARFLT